MNVDQMLAISPVVPVVTIRDAGAAVPVARALQDGGVRVIEVTLRTEASLDGIERIARELPSMTVLAGTVCHAPQVRASLAAGAAGIVSPGLTEALAAAIEGAGAAWLPGVATASDILRGLAFGLDRFKLFPASVAGGPEALRAFAGPFPGARFCPTGGIDRAAVQRYLELPNVACVGGSWVATDRMIEAGDWPAIRANAEFVTTLRTARGAPQ
ncbi:MAG: bifunctional 4-hydroxy-2-oxoglutarate aldolase/2-dehydro-3-deoxy-phosphogluconate aldolase [Betaproteobacteria bacterium]